MSVRVADDYNISYSQANDVRANAGGTAKRPMGIYIPLYWTPWNNTLKNYCDYILNYIKSNPDINFLIAINPASGYGFNRGLVDYTYLYQQAGAKILGYISVNYGTQNWRGSGAWGTVTWPDTSLAKLKEQASLYLRDYYIDGYMLDDHPSVLKDSRDTFGNLSYVNRNTYAVMQDLNNYMKSIFAQRGKPAPFVKANTGTFTAAEYFWMYQAINVWEAEGIWGSQYNGYNQGYPTYQDMWNRQWNGYYAGHSTVTIKFSPFNTALMDKIVYRFKYISVHETEYTSPASSLPAQIKWCQKYW